VTLLPSFVPSIVIPTGATVRKIMGGPSQSNTVGTGDPYTSQNLTDVPLYQYTGAEYLPTAGSVRRLGSMFRNQIAASSPQKKFGVYTQAAIDLKAAGKAPVVANFGQGGMPLSTWLSGAGQTAYLAWADEVIAIYGASGMHVFLANGENEANSLATSLTHQADLTSTAAMIRTKFPDSRIYQLQLNVNYSTTAAWRDNVRAGIIAFVAGDGNAEMLDGDAFGYASPHYTTTGYNSIGSLFATRVLVNQP
jgi:hypothetical protein